MTRLTTARALPSSTCQPRVAVALLVALGATAGSAARSDEPAFMSGAWAGTACAAWNQDPILTDDLVKSGWIKNDKGADYVMHATTERWKQMGAGEYGAMKAMMLGRLSFSGPYGEAMGNMGPFGNFLLLAGKVPGSATCP